MPANSLLIRRSGDLKRSLIDYVMEPRFERMSRRVVEREFGASPMMDEAELANFLDRLALQERLPDGRTVVEHFVAEHPELPDDERQMLLGWRDVVEGVFEVERRDGDALLATNLLDEMTYRIVSNVGPRVFRQMPRGSFVGTRLVPIGDDWMFSGIASIIPKVMRQEIYRVASELAAISPQLVFRNPEKLARGWELQREERGHFIDFFGADLVVVPGHALAERMQSYMEYRQYQARDEDGTTAAERARAAYGSEPPPIDHEFPAEFGRAKTVGMIYDEVEGLSYFLEFGRFAEAFANPALATDRRHRQVVMTYLKDSSISPLPFRRLAERDPERASQVFQRVLKQPAFSWERDGEALLRRHKAAFFDEPPLPSIVPMSEQQTRALLPTPEPARPRSHLRSARGKWWK